MPSELTDEYIRKAMARLEELQPLVEEAEALRRALAALEGSDEGDGERPEGQRLPATTRKRQILTFLRQQPDLRAKDLAEMLDVSPSRIAQILKEMEAEGLIERHGGTLDVA